MSYGGAYSIGLREFEQPFFGPNTEHVIQPNMVIAIDIYAFGYPQIPGIRYEEVSVTTKDEKERLSKCDKTMKAC